MFLLKETIVGVVQEEKQKGKIYCWNDWRCPENKQVWLKRIEKHQKVPHQGDYVIAVRKYGKLLVLLACHIFSEPVGNAIIVEELLMNKF